MAAATAIVAAPLTPAFSKSGAKARPVAGPPVRQHGTGQHAHQGFDPDEDGDPHAPEILQHGKDGRGHKKDKDLRPALS